MSHDQFHQTVQQFEELEAEGQHEATERERMDRLDEQAERDFVKGLEDKFPILRAWPIKEQK